MYKKLNQAHKRPMTARERFGLLLFILQFLISKFGIFIVFLSFNVIGNIKIQDTKVNSANFSGYWSQSIRNPQRCEASTVVDKVAKHPLFSKLKIYCIIATIVTLFLNPQQTKYFGGLAVALKQAGLFSKYGKSEKMVYIFSWIFIVLFAQMSYSNAFLESAGGLRALVTEYQHSNHPMIQSNFIQMLN